MKKRSTYLSLSFEIEKHIFYVSSNSYHDFLFAQMEIIFPVETVNECVSIIFKLKLISQNLYKDYF